MSSEASSSDNQASDLDVDNGGGVLPAKQRGGTDTGYDPLDTDVGHRNHNRSPDKQQRFRYSISELKNLREDTACKQLPDFYDARLTFWRRYGRSSEEEQNPPPPPSSRERRERPSYDSNGSSGGSTRSEPRRGDRGDRGERGDSKDPKERLKKEDNIILSPQRRSFNMGCQMPPSSNNNPPLAGSSLLRSDRDILSSTNSRRIGSGRILARDVPWDYRAPPEKKEEPEFNFRANNQRGSEPPYREEKSSYQPRQRNNERNEYNERREERPNYDRSSAPRSYNSRNGPSNGGGGYNDRRRNYNDKDEEPEWFSGGPTSQHDTIELHGFDGPEEKDNTRKGGNKGDDQRRVSNKDDELMFDDRGGREFDEREEARAGRDNGDSNNNKDQDGNQRRENAGNLGNMLNSKLDDDAFNFEEFLNIDSITGLLSTVS